MGSIYHLAPYIQPRAFERFAELAAVEASSLIKADDDDAFDRRQLGSG